MLQPSRISKSFVYFGETRTRQQIPESSAEASTLGPRVTFEMRNICERKVDPLVTAKVWAAQATNGQSVVALLDTAEKKPNWLFRRCFRTCTKWISYQKVRYTYVRKYRNNVALWVYRIERVLPSTPYCYPRVCLECRYRAKASMKIGHRNRSHVRECFLSLTVSLLILFPYPTLLQLYHIVYRIQTEATLTSMTNCKSTTQKKRHAARQSKREHSVRPRRFWDSRLWWPEGRPSLSPPLPLHSTLSSICKSTSQKACYDREVQHFFFEGSSFEGLYTSPKN